MSDNKRFWSLAGLSAGSLLAFGLLASFAQQPNQRPSSYTPVAEDKLEDVIARMSKAKPDVQKKQADLLAARYDLADKAAQGATMSRGKKIQEGVRVKLPSDVTWDQLAAMSPDEIREKGVWPKGFLPLPHPNHAEGGMTFP